ncbi:MAG: Tad domain-containing protein [Candidatus Eremiobacteraeota bacterium]|nr:Tad domain-containing protein [Candidatus Eremiobacteraeota bacterium]MBV8499290.1 Tad domain-containing protein [Candidatus Eremiobacteraeota bacterium]
MNADHERGQVLPLIAVALAVLMGFAGIAVDVGYLEYRQQSQQSATDAAAAGGAEALLHAGCPNQSAADAAAQLNAGNNGYPSGGNIAVTTNNPPASGPFASDSCAVAVTINSTHNATFFSKLFGYANGMNESTLAVAEVQSTGPGCIFLLSMTADQNFNGANVNAAKCGMLINNTANFNGANLHVLNIGYAGAAPNENGASFTEAVPAPMLPVTDPCPEILGCAYLTANPPPIANCQSFNGNGYNGAINPGCYSDINLNGANVTMNPGTYVFNGNTNFNGAHITGNGITMYVTASGTPPNFNGVSSATLTPPTSGGPQGVLYYQVPTNTNPPNFNGSNGGYSGLIYAPGAISANFNGAQGKYLVVVFGSANFNGGNALDIATPPPDQSLIRQAVVAQ